MGLLGWILVILSAPIFILQALKDEEEKSKGQLRLGVLLLLVGIVIIFLGR